MEIRINRGGEEYGPYDLGQVNEMLAEGSLLPTDLAWHDPMETWAELSHVAAQLNEQSGGAAAVEATAAGEFRGSGRYRIIKQLGRGGMGVVYLALDEQLQEQVALKSFPPEMAVDEGALDDMKREVQKSRKLSHPNIIRMHDFVNPPGEDPFVTMEFVEGQELADMRRDQSNGVFAWNDIEDYILQLCDALTTAHSENTVHRDLKPTQMMINTEGRLKLCDFGIAASMADSISFSSMKHAVSGTLLFMSPQQMNGEVPRATDDIYALGATLYDLMTGKPPFYTGNVNVQVMSRPAISMKERLKEFGIENDIPDYIDQLVLACLSKEPEHRPASAEEIKNWILTEGGAATLKTVRLAFRPPGFKKELVFDVNRKAFHGVCAAAAVLVIGLIAWTVLKPPPEYDIPQLKQQLAQNRVLFNPMDSSTDFSSSYYRMVGAIQYEDRQADRGIRVINNASSTNYLEILNYRGRGLETVQEGQGYTLSAHFMPYDLPSDDNPKDQQFAVLVKQGHHIGLSYGADKRFAMSHQFIEGSKTNLVAAISSGKFDVNEWHHVVGTVDRSEGLVKIYVNGKETGSASFAKNSLGVKSANVWRVGAAAPRGQSHRWMANAAVDQVRIYKEALDAEQAHNLFIVEQPVPFEKELLIHYTFAAGELKNIKERLPSKGFTGGFTPTEFKDAGKPEMTEDRFGESGQAFLFNANGTTNGLYSANGGGRSYPLAKATESRTLCAWFKAEELTAQRQSIVALGSSAANGGWEILVSQEEGLVGNWGGDTNYLSGGSIKAGQWHHAALSYDESLKIISLYLDGQQLGTFTNEVATTYSGYLRVGRSLAGSAKRTRPRPKKKGEAEKKEFEYANFTGAIDDVRLYVRNLEPIEVKELYSAEKPASWFWAIVAGSVLGMLAIAGILFWRGVRLPAKLMDPVLKILPQKLAAPLAKLKKEETAVPAGASA